MIRYYIKTSRDSKLREIKNIVRGCWIYIVNPEKKEIDKMVKKLGVSRDFITDPLDENERSRIEVDGDNIFIVFRIPHYVNKKILTMPLGIIITKSYFVTVSINKNVILDDFLKEKVKGFYTTKKTRFLLQIFARVNKYYISYLHEVERMVKDIEKGLAYSFKNEKIISLLELEKILVYFNTSVISNGNVMERIFRGNIIRLYEEDQDLLEDIIIENKQAIEMINIYTNILTSSMDAYASIIS
ncbi:MAG TPA: magnesium transporter CorA family protein, partial [Candidatus Aenigmarchaeota archaeon]|nr:magnesium transporter CorA family protein [Candidatus Aenigmarchaeota archaeon]